MNDGAINADAAGAAGLFGNTAVRDAGAGTADDLRGAGSRVVVPIRTAKLPTAAASEATALLGMIERIAADPSMDIERVERMYAMYERAAARNAKAAYDEALSAMQPDLPIIDKRGKSNNGKYALWEDIAEGILSVTAKHGFSLTFRVKSADKLVDVTAVLAHRDGHREETSFPFPLDASGSKSPIQSVGSSISYGKRYTACAILNVITKGEDDDGKGAIKQKSSAAAKKDGTDRLFNEIVGEIRSAINVEMLRHIAETRREEVDAMPFKWRDLAREEYSLKLDELKAAAAE